MKNKINLHVSLERKINYSKPDRKLVPASENHSFLRLSPLERLSQQNGPYLISIAETIDKLGVQGQRNGQPMAGESGRVTAMIEPSYCNIYLFLTNYI